jgi:hypothetical protein
VSPKIVAKILTAIASGAIGWILAPGRDKAEWVRLVDVFIYGSLLLALAAWPALAAQPWAAMLLIFIGASTITYNGRNWLRVLKSRAVVECIAD